jgi:multisubunit Na+/H+ antiporter MnhF subunit
MDLDRMSTGEKIADASAVLLFIFMFFEWFNVDISGGEGLFTISGGFNAWESFSFIDIILLITVLAAVAVAVIRLTDALVEPPVSVNAVVAILGAISVLLIVYRIIDPPDFGVDVSGFDVGPSIGVFLGLIAAAGIAYGGYRAMQEEGTGFGDLGDQFSSRGGPGAGAPPPPSSTTPPPPPPPPSSGQGGPPPQ